MNDELIIDAHSDQLVDIMTEKWGKNYDDGSYTFEYEVTGKRMFHYYKDVLFGHTIFDIDENNNIMATFFDYT